VHSHTALSLWMWWLSVVVAWRMVDFSACARQNGSVGPRALGDVVSPSCGGPITKPLLKRSSAAPIATLTWVMRPGADGSGR
jgi:hypothetical protein